MRAHVVIPDQMVEEIDRLVGPRQRSQFFVEAVREKLDHIRLAEATEAILGSLSATDVPEWATAESARDWVHVSRQASSYFTDRLAAE
jgi:metal-responsive CopG/Arc/MetJ family transcriptional regulator